MFFRKKSPKAGAARLEQEMKTITDQAMANAVALREGRPLNAIAHAKTETLFVEKNAEGETVFNHYHFSEDMNQLDPEAQIHLMQFFGQIITFNDLLEHKGVERRLDWITANAVFFERYFARADVSTAMLMNHPESAIAKTMESIVSEDRSRMKTTLKNMFEPGIDALVPRSTVPFMVAMGKPYEEGQQFINGVYFSAQAAPAVMRWIASLQAQSTKPAQNTNPAHA